jgi:hypothetical protein
MTQTWSYLGQPGERALPHRCQPAVGTRSASKWKVGEIVRYFHGTWIREEVPLGSCALHVTLVDAPRQRVCLSRVSETSLVQGYLELSLIETRN